MARLRYSRAEAEVEATRRAEAFVANRPDRDQWRYGVTYPDSLRPPSRSSEHPLAWVVVFTPIPPEGCIIDGGELFVGVDLESGSVAVRSF